MYKGKWNNKPLCGIIVVLMAFSLHG